MLEHRTPDRKAWVRCPMPPNTLRVHTECRNCGGGDRGRVAIYRPFGELRRAKIVLSPVWCSRPTTGVPLAHATMNFVGLDLTASDRRVIGIKPTVQNRLSLRLPTQRSEQLLF
ncbi:hypothetical protein TNCV_3738891 [Trichonephila clavipes]|nr:hypothetical protein TNCV_3738891 [Trichonephila clavipes]